MYKIEKKLGQAKKFRNIQIKIYRKLLLVNT